MSVNADWFRTHDGKKDRAGLCAVVGPVVDGAALDQCVTCIELHDLGIELDLDRAGQCLVAGSSYL